MCRINRLRYFLYNLSAVILWLVPFSILMETGAEDAAIMFFSFGYLLYLIWSVLISIRRANDVGLSGWYSLLVLFIPFASLYFLFKEGDAGENKYGKPPL